MSGYRQQEVRNSSAKQRYGGMPASLSCSIGMPSVQQHRCNSQDPGQRRQESNSRVWQTRQSLDKSRQPVRIRQHSGEAKKVSDYQQQDPLITKRLEDPVIANPLLRK